LADKSTRLILEALGRAAIEPSGIALLASKSDPGLFPSTTVAKTAADRCKDEGYLRVVRSEVKGKQSREICVLTEKGLQFLIEQSSPKEILDDFVRVLESRHSEVSQINENVKHLQESIQGMQRVIQEVLPRLQEPKHYTNGSGKTNGVAQTPLSNRNETDALIAEIKTKLAEWFASVEASQDCPLPELYRRLQVSKSVTIGQFHDCLRLLFDDQQIALHPWTGPLYALPEPAFALLVGHEIAYYANIR
jgi:hypothetical protein